MPVLRSLAWLLIAVAAFQPSALAYKGQDHHSETKHPHVLCKGNSEYDHSTGQKASQVITLPIFTTTVSSSNNVAKPLADPMTRDPTTTVAVTPTTTPTSTTPTFTVNATPAVVTASPVATTAPLSLARLTKKAAQMAAMAVDPLVAPLATVTYNGVGGSGLYGQVANLVCSGTDTCAQTDFAVSGPLAPFDEDLTLALRGPMNVDDIAVFTASDGSSWSRVSSYSRQAGMSQNMVFLNNKGDPAKSGVFDTCNGNSQSYATADGKSAASTASQFSGVLDDGVELNIMSATSCAVSGTCGFSRGVAQEGWKGNNKIFMVKATMPSASTGGKDLPAIWLLNGQAVRTAQYGCNCRGVGDKGKWKGGCGELDMAEVLPGDSNALTSTIYSFKGSRGTSMYAQRPVTDAVVFVVIFSDQATTGSTNLGMAQVLMFKPEDVDMATAPSNEHVQQWLMFRNGVQVNFNI